MCHLLNILLVVFVIAINAEPKLVDEVDVGFSLIYPDKLIGFFPFDGDASDLATLTSSSR